MDLEKIRVEFRKLFADESYKIIQGIYADSVFNWLANILSNQVDEPVKPEICARISKINSGGSFIDSERLSKRFTEYNLIPQLETKINLISEDGQYLEQFEVIQIYYEVDKKLKIDIYLDEY